MPVDRIGHHPQQMELSPNFEVAIGGAEGFGRQDDAPRQALQQARAPSAVDAGHDDIPESWRQGCVDDQQVPTVQPQALSLIRAQAHVTDGVGLGLQQLVEVLRHAVILYSLGCGERNC